MSRPIQSRREVTMNADQLRELQAPLKTRYRESPAAALVTL
jgi:hypothetical protein